MDIDAPPTLPPLTVLRSCACTERTAQVVLTSHLVDLNYLTLSKKVWDRLTPQQQATLQKAADDASASGRQTQLQLEGELEAFFKEKGLKVYTPDLAAFRKQVQDAYLKSDLSKNWEKGALDKINAL